MDFLAVEEFLCHKNEPNFRLKQIRSAFYQQNLTGFNDISNLPEDLRNELGEKFSWLLFEPVKTQGSLKKGIVKALLRLSDGYLTETVLMVYRDWITACLSVSVGCSLSCQFCATGQMGFKRNLTSSEIVDQIVFWNQYLHSKLNRVSRVVFMGMGEPFLNWENTERAIKIINDPQALNIGARHITVSTAGVIPGIDNFTKLDSQINLAISLHSPFQEKREQIMPIAQKYPLPELMAAAKNYVQKTRRKLFFEYALIDGFNDRSEDAQELKKLFTEPLYHLNIISLNHTPSTFTPSSQLRLTKFTSLLNQFRISYTIRRSLGEEIEAACGQLAGKIVTGQIE